MDLSIINHLDLCALKSNCLDRRCYLLPESFVLASARIFFLVSLLFAAV